MFTRRPRTARELVSKAGRIPALAAVASLSLLCLPSALWAQPVRDPLKSADRAQEDKSKAKVAVSEHMTVDLHLKDEDLANVLELLSIQTQKNIVASKGVSGKVTATLYGVTFYQALDAILHVNGFGYIEQGNFIYVHTQEELKTIQASMRKRFTKAIRLNYMNADDAKEFCSILLSKEGGEIKVNTKTKPFTMPDKSPTGANDYALGDLMVVTDFEENVKAVEDMVRQIDTRPQQVLVEATILQTSLNESNAFGVDFSVIGDLNFVDFINTGGALSAANSLIKGGTGAVGQGFSPSNDRGNAVSSNVGNTQGPGGLKVGVMAGDVAVFVRLLDQITDTVILSNPKILALNRQPARVLVGKRVGYLNTTQTETSTTQSVEFLDTGTQLYFRPFIASTGEVRMELKPQVSSAEIRTVTDSGGRAVTIPDEVTQEMVTNVNVRDGQTVVLGGLFTDNTTFTRRQVPWLGDIPILGSAFRGNEDTTVRSEIIFLITPTIVTDTLMASAADRANADIDYVRTGMRQNLIQWSREKRTDALNVNAERLAREGDFKQALFNLQRSLSLNPNQPAAIRLRSMISGQSEHWSDASVLNSYFDNELVKRNDSIPQSPNAEPHLWPRGSKVVPIETAPKMHPGAWTEPKAMDMQTAEMPAIMMPGQAAASMYFSSSPAGTQNSNSQRAGVPGSGEKSSAPATAPTQPAAEPASTTTSAEQHSMGWTPAADLAAFVPSISEPSGNFSPSESAAVSANPATPASVSGMSEPWVQTTVAVSEPTSAQTFSNDFPGFVAPMPNAGSNIAGTVAPTAASSIKVTQSSYTAPVLSDVEKRFVSEVRQALPTLRGQIELYSMMHSGAVPQLGGAENNGWGDLVMAQLLKDLPANPYVGGNNSTKVVVGEKADESFKGDYGWIFNPKTGKLWAAGFDASDRPMSKTASTTTVSVPESAQPAKTGATAGVETDGSNK